MRGNWTRYMEKENISKFIKLYNEVIDNNGNVKVCGRDKCKELIEISDKIDKNTYYGNINTGMLNIEALKTLHNKVVNI